MTRHRFGPFFASFVLALSFIFFALAGIYTVRQQHHVDDRICDSAVENRAGLRRTWMAAERFIIQGQTTEEAQQRTRVFFESVLNEIPPLMCVDREPVEVVHE